MKKFNLLWALLLITVFLAFALGSGESNTNDQGSGSANVSTAAASAIGKYSVVIDSCRLATDYEGKPVVIVKYIFSNVNDDNAAAFYLTFEDHVYQNGVGLNEAYILKDNANYNSDNQTKEIKKGASLEVEVAYALNDTSTEIEVEVEELFSFDDSKITKKFSIAG